ncbi:hypothetical protein [Tsukamurella ocularis]|uniref:hypothetical protein n=1 Tax=Tsukamurella ocularis TaxID=1970234 RepID=UPI002169531F|nr:hypothetical protein [Tsukamurella ocularis]MCS3779574.1 hypothetical protein [Tsukamurella ocularis]MCS3789026.1 hypothetical protein [Tsukamurella ocularis]MCS3850236.1 hypothetical protein [Tsukamurella ocularis]
MQKTLDLLDKMKQDTLPRLDAPRRELQAEAERLSKRVAAYHRVPTEWMMILVLFVGYGWTYGGMFGLLHWRLRVLRDVDWPNWGDAIFWVAFVVFLSPGYALTKWGLEAIGWTRHERHRFVREGLPKDFVQRYSRRPKSLMPEPSGWDRAPVQRISRPLPLWMQNKAARAELRRRRSGNAEESPGRCSGGAA